MIPEIKLVQVFDEGYAIPSYGIEHYFKHWQYKTEFFVVKPGLKPIEYKGWPVLPVEEIRKNVATGGS